MIYVIDVSLHPFQLLLINLFPNDIIDGDIFLLHPCNLASFRPFTVAVIALVSADIYVHFVVTLNLEQWYVCK